MTAKQILDAFSETLMRDERILSPREQELLINILQTSKTLANHKPETQSAVAEAIARAVGETVAQRAFTELGGSIVERILAGSGVSARTEEALSSTAFRMDVPQPPSGPGPHAVPRGVPQPPSGPLGVPQPPSVPVPQPPSRPAPKDVPAPVPQPPSGPHGVRRVGVAVQQDAHQGHPDSAAGIGVMEAPVVCAQCVVLDEFLAPQELDELVNYALEHEAEFQTSQVLSPSGEPGTIDYNHRRSCVLMDLGKHQDVILERIRGVLPRVLDQLGIDEFPVTHTEAQITASNDGDFFGAHCDDAQSAIASRHITFVYFFHREPRPFGGGELHLYDSREGNERFNIGDRTGAYQTIVPQQNQIVFFPCSVMHEITTVECPSKAFADSRFTLNGWLHK